MIVRNHMAILRNLRNIDEVGVSKKHQEKLRKCFNDPSWATSKVLPFRFISAARYAPKWEPELEQAMFKCIETQEKLPGKTAIVIDNSGSMHGTPVSKRSEIDRADAACALAILLREICEKVVVIGYGSEAKIVPARRGFALAEAIKNGPGGGTNTQTAINLANSEGYDRIIVVTDEQSHQDVGSPNGKGYFINVDTYQNGIGYGKWLHIDGWSESVINYIREFENSSND